MRLFRVTRIELDASYTHVSRLLFFVASEIVDIPPRAFSMTWGGAVDFTQRSESATTIRPRPNPPAEGEINTPKPAIVTYTGTPTPPDRESLKDPLPLQDRESPKDLPPPLEHVARLQGRAFKRRNQDQPPPNAPSYKATTPKPTTVR